MSSAMNHKKRSHRTEQSKRSVCTGWGLRGQSRSAGGLKNRSRAMSRVLDFLHGARGREGKSAEV